MAARVPDRPLATLSGHNGPIHALTYSSGTGQYLLSGSSDRTINLYNPSKALSSASNPSTSTSRINSSSNVSAKPTLPPPPSSAALIQSYTGVHGYEVLTLAVSNDNSRFASGGGDKTVFLWDVATAKTLRRYGGGPGGHAGRVECVAFGGEGDSVVVSGSFDGTVRFWDTKGGGGRPIMVLSEAGDSVSCLEVRGEVVVSGCVDGRVRWYDLRMGMVGTDVVGEPITSLTPTHATDAVLISTLDSTLRLLDRPTGKLLKSYTSPSYINKTYRIRSTLAAKNSVALAGAEDGCVYAWDVLTGECTQRMRHVGSEGGAMVRASRNVVSAVACRRGEAEWASAGGNGNIVIWG